MPYSDLSTEDLQALKQARTSGDYSKVSTAALQAYKGVRDAAKAPAQVDAGPKAPTGVDGQPYSYKSPGGDTVGARFADPRQWQAALTGTGPAQKHYETEGGAVPLALPAEALPGAIMAASKFLNRDAPARVGAQAVMGAAQDPDHPVRGALVNAGIAGGLETAGAALQGPVKRLTTWLGGKSAGIQAPAAEAYVQDPSAAQALYDEQSKDALSFKQRMEDQISQGRQNLQSNVLDPLKSQLSKLGIGKSFRVNPAQFEGTEAHPEIADAWNKQGNTAPAQPPSANQKYLNTGPQGQVPAPLPEGNVGLTLEQALRGKRAAGQASKIAYSPNGAALSPADAAAAKANSEASDSLGRAIEGGAPGAADIHDQLHEAMQHKQYLENMNTPGQILQSSDAPASSNLRATRQYFDENAGTNFEHQANQLQAARTLNGGFNPLEAKSATGLASALMGGTGKALLNTAAKANAAGSTMKDSVVPLSVILDQLRSGNGGTQGQ